MLDLNVPYDNLNHNPSYRISRYFAVRLMIILKKVQLFVCGQNVC